ncbi:Cytochrome P450 71D9 [Glycine soja]
MAKTSLGVARNDTSSATITWTMAEMIKNPRIMEKAQAEESLIKVDREYGQACEINRYTYEKQGHRIGRDPNLWTEAERFIESSVDYKGNNFQFIPFGAGRRMCPGLTFGLSNVECVLAMLMYHFDWKLPNGMKHEDLDMTEIFGITVTRKDNLYLIPKTFHT